MNEGLRHLLEDAEKRRDQRVLDEERLRQFEEREERIFRELAANCGAGLLIRFDRGFIRVEIRGEALLISDMDVALKQILQDEKISVTFQVREHQVVMEVVIRCFSSAGCR